MVINSVMAYAILQIEAFGPCFLDISAAHGAKEVLLDLPSKTEKVAEIIFPIFGGVCSSGHMLHNHLTEYRPAIYRENAAGEKACGVFWVLRARPYPFSRESLGGDKAM